MVQGSQEVDIARAVEEGNVALILKAVEAAHGTEVFRLLLGQHNLRSLAEDHLCQAVIAGDTVQMIQCAKLLEALRICEQPCANTDTEIVLPQGTPDRCANTDTEIVCSEGVPDRPVRKNDHIGEVVEPRRGVKVPLPRRRDSKKSIGGARAARARNATATSPTGACWKPRPPSAPEFQRQTCEEVSQSFWEAEVQAAWQREDAVELHWAVRMAGEAGVFKEKLRPAKQALQHLAQAALADALETGDTAAIAPACRLAEELGVAKEQVAEARLVGAECSRDPQLIEQEMAHAVAAGVVPPRVEQAKQLAAFIRDTELSALGFPTNFAKDADAGSADRCMSSPSSPSTAWSRHSRLDATIVVDNITETSSSCSCCTATTETASAGSTSAGSI